MNGPVFGDHGADIHYSPARTRKIWKGCLHQHERPAHIGVEEPVKIFRWDTTQILTKDAGSGIVDDNVDGFGVEGFKGCLDEVFTKVWTLLISGDSNSLDTKIFNSFDGFGGSGSIFAIMDDNLGCVSLISSYRKRQIGLCSL
jgi:hypothetical protein